MAFSSIAFLFYFFPLALLVYSLGFFSNRCQNALLVFLSLGFYAWGESRYFGLFVGVILFNYVMGLLIGNKRQSLSRKKAWLVIGILINLAVLIGWKYIPFFSSVLAQATGGTTRVLQWVMPVGVSYYIFSALSYLIDVYRQEVQSEKNLISLALYFSFFPKIMQGPISKYSHFTAQTFAHPFDLNLFATGGTRFIIGLSKKILIANQMGIVTDRIFELNQMDEMSVVLAWLGLIAYTLQIYFDFSGYSDMAIGLGNMFGFRLEENFNYPYTAQSISDFWRRWHMTLGRWFREYLYFPLGGSRVKNQDILIRNLMIVWVITGLWHGANWTFLIWGIWNGLFIVIERMFKFEKSQLPRAFRHVYTMLVVMLGWVFFRSGSIVEAGSYFEKLINFIEYPLVNDYVWLFLKEYSVFYVAGIIFSLPIAPLVNYWFTYGIDLRQRIAPYPFTMNHRLTESVPLRRVVQVCYPVVLLVLFVISVMYIVKGTYNSFIYFQF